MSTAQKLVQKQGQTLNFTTQMRQAIELLEFSNLDLQAHISTQIMENPFLEGEEQELSSEEKKSSDDDNVAEINPDNDKLSSDSPEGYEDETMWKSDQRLSSKNDRSNSGDFDKFQNIPANEINLRDHLLSQINTDINNEQDRLVAAYLLDSLDETGYLTTPLSKIAQTLGADLMDLERVVKQLKRFDPVGIFAGSLQECLSLQLKELGELSDKTKTILEYIDLFADAKIDMLLKKANCSPQELKNVIEKLRRLDPKPGLKFQSTSVQTLIPDVFVRKEKNQMSWIVSLNSETLPKVLVTQDYKMRAGLNLKKDKELRKYYQERMGEANWLVRALDQRAQNILKVVQEIVNQQKAFFEKGISALKPMNLRQVADKINVHESTVSRITQNKYMNCPRGTFELRYFFSASITNAWTGEDQSALQIQHKIQQLVKGEDPKKPLSDDKLVLKLGEHNFDIARRTISKYRELLKIPSSYERKRQHLRNL